MTLPNTSGARGVSVQHNGVGPGVFSNTVGGNSIWGVVGSISAAALIGDSTSGEAVVAPSERRDLREKHRQMQRHRRRRRPA